MRNTPRRLLCLLVLAFLTHTGCARSEAERLIGTWRMEGPGESFVGKLVDRLSLEVKFARDGTMTITAPTPLPGSSLSHTGSWKFIRAEGNVLTILASPIARQEQAAEVNIEVHDENTIEMLPPGSLVRTTVTFKRVAK